MSAKEKILRKVSIITGLLIIIAGILFSLNLTKTEEPAEKVEKIAIKKSVEVRKRF